MANSVLAKMAVEIAANTAQFNRSLSQSSAQFNKFASGIQNTAKGIVAGFGIMTIGNDVIRVTSEFQKFEAILTNTLGSNSAAQKALKEIKDFAVTTPFEVSEVTAAYVRWANQGLSPTIDRMRKLGDVASSLGAGFEQTAEAFKDLAVGQTKRLEEIGISATQANGKIQLSFKGVNIEIEKNAEGVQKALEVYSQLNGVLGTSDAVSKTLGGRISNLKDAWAALMLSIGEGTSGPLFGAISALTTLTTAMANFGKEIALISQAVSPFHDLRDVSKETLDYLMKFGRTDAGNAVAEVLKPFTSQEPIEFLQNFDANYKAFIETLVKEGESVTDANVLWKHYAETQLEVAKSQKQALSDERFAAIKKEIELAKERLKIAQEEANINRFKNSPSIPIDNLSGITPNALPGFTPALTIEDAYKRAQEATQKYIEGVDWQLWSDNQDKMKEKTLDTIQSIESMSMAFGSAFGSLIDGSQNAAQAFGQAASHIVQSIGRMIMAQLIQKAIQDKATDFNFFAKLALIGVATGVASSLINRIGAGGGGAGGGGYASSGSRFNDTGTRVDSAGQRIEIALVDNAGRLFKTILSEEDRKSGRTKIVNG